MRGSTIFPGPLCPIRPKGIPALETLYRCKKSKGRNLCVPSALFGTGIACGVVILIWESRIDQS